MPKEKKILYVYEFALDEKKGEPDALWNAVEKNLSGVKIAYAKGLSNEYSGGGTSLKRLVNFFYMHIACPFKILIERPDLIFIRTTPPLIQISYGFWGRIFGAKTLLWLMDYHPLMGLRMSKHSPLKRAVWKFFDALDKLVLSKFSKVICLDKAMQDLIGKRARNVETFVSPTFNIAKAEWSDLSHPNKSGEIKLLYSGNLGRAHSTSRLEYLLKKLSKKRKLSLTFCGRSMQSKEILKKLALSCSAEFEFHDFIKNYADLGKFYAENKFDYGIVLLNDELAGIVSPSKFSGFSSFGLPIIYLGPKGTNADILCTEFKAGLSADSKEQIDELAEKVLAPDTQAICAKNTRNSLEYFSPKAAKALARELEKML